MNANSLETLLTKLSAPKKYEKGYLFICDRCSAIVTTANMIMIMKMLSGCWQYLELTIFNENSDIDSNDELQLWKLTHLVNNGWNKITMYVTVINCSNDTNFERLNILGAAGAVYNVVQYHWRNFSYGLRRVQKISTISGNVFCCSSV